MALIEQKEAAKQIRQNKDTHEDCQAAIFYNKGCEHSAQIVEQMKGQEIIHCTDCLYKEICSWKRQGAKFCSYGVRGEADADNG